MKKERTVLYFQASFCDINLRHRSGFYGFARKAGWFVHVIEYGDHVAEGSSGDRPRGCPKRGEAEPERHLPADSGQNSEY